MKINHICLLSLCFALASGCCNLPKKDPIKGFALGEVIDQVKHELEAAQSVPSAGLNLALKKVEISLAVANVIDLKGQMTVGVPSLGLGLGFSSGRKHEESSTLYVELAPPAANALLSGADRAGLGLTQAIVDARDQLAMGLNEEPRLDPKKVVITIKFGVTESSSGSGELKIVAVSLGGSALRTTSDVSTIILTFDVDLE